jgi:hypothetical protein
MSKPPSNHRTQALISGALAAISALFWWGFYERYVKYEDCISQLTNSSCLTPDGGNVTAAGIYWGLLALCFDCMALFFICVILFRFLRETWRSRERTRTWRQ